MSLNGRQILNPRQCLLAACVALLALPGWGRADEAPRPDLRETKANRHKAINERLEKPVVIIKDGTKIASDAKSPYAVELLVRRTLQEQAKPREAKDEKGQAFVDVKIGEYYEVRVI